MCLRRAFLLLVLATLVAIPVSAQVTTADLVGRVLDPKGLAVAGAKVTVTNPQTGFTRETESADTGDFAVTLLPTGVYKVTVAKSGFATMVYEKVALLVGQKLTLDVNLRLGAAREIVTVTEQQPLVETTRSDLGSAVSPEEVKDLPILDRNFANLALVVPGVRPAQGFDPTKSRVGNFSVNGSDGRAVDVNVDGGDNKDNVVGGPIQNFTLEGIQEFNVVTNRYTAESGRSIGAVVNVISKSGTNGLHGSLFGLFQSSSLNKIDFFSAQQGIDKPVFHRYHFGGSVGGPIFKDKLFFFGAYEHKREPGSISVEPTAFSELSRFPLAKPVTLLSTAYKDHLATVKVDHRISDRQNMSYRYGRERWENPNDQLGSPFITDLTETQGDTNQFHDLVIQHNYSFSSTKVNSINIHFQDFVNAILQAPTTTFTLPVAGGGTATNPNVLFPSAEIGTNVNIPQLTTIRKYQVRDDFAWILGRHNMKMGVNYLYLAKLGGFFFFGANGYQIFFWDDPSTILANPGAYPQTFATPGAIREIDFSGGNGSFTQRPHALGLYYQDDYKITPRLTLNLGVRWDGNINFRPQQLGSSLTDTNRTIGVLRAIIAANPAASSAADGLARAKAIAGNDDDLRRTTTSFKEFQPRIGFAWDPTGSGKQVIRGGYGIAYDQVFQNLTLFSLQQTNATIYQTLLQLVDSTGPLPSGPTGPLATFRFGVDPLPTPTGSGVNIEPGAFGRINDPKLNDPYAQQWSIGWAWQFSPDFSFSADFYHTLGIHESRVININPQIRTLCDSSFPGSSPSDPRCVRGASTRFFDAAFVAASLGAGRLEQTNMIGTTNRSRFDGVTFQLKKRFSHGNTFQASYVISRSVSWGGRPTASYSGNGIAITPENQFKDGEYVPTIFDERHRVVISGVFQLPFGFEIAPIFQAASPRPFRFRAGRDNDGDGRTTIDRVCVGTTTGMTLAQRIASQVPGCPEVPQNALRGDPFIQLDTRFAKKFTFKERMNLRLYYEVYNIFNRNNFCDNFGENSSSSNFNTPLGYCGGQGFGAAYSGPLRSQFGFRFEF